MESIGEITVDSSGSVAIPKEICEQAGFTPGKRLTIERDQTGTVHLQAVEAASAENSASKEINMVLVNEGGVMVLAPERDVPLPLHLAEWLRNAVELDREARIQKFIREAGFESTD